MKYGPSYQSLTRSLAAGALVGFCAAACGTATEPEAGGTDTLVPDAGVPGDDTQPGAGVPADDVEGEPDAYEPPEPPDFAGPSFECIFAACDVTACTEAPECARAIDCVGDCETIHCALQCQAGAAPPFKSPVGKLVECGIKSECFAGGSGIETCGDGACQEAESLLTCPEDCSLAGDPEAIYQCLMTSCDTGDCVTDNACTYGVKCLAGCTDSACTSNCVSAVSWHFRWILLSLAGCGVSKECLPPEAEMVCGNGHCDMIEGKLSCPDDCGAPPEAYACIIEQCEPWPCPNMGKCNNALLCIAGCKDAACTSGCIAKGPNHSKDLLAETAQCAADKGCIPAAAAPCVPSCDGKECGGDGCGGTCGEAPCDDGLSCTEDSCVDGKCAFAPAPGGGCVLDGACVEPGTASIEEPCLVCEPATSATAYTPLPDGAGCGDGKVCKEGTCTEEEAGNDA